MHTLGRLHGGGSDNCTVGGNGMAVTILFTGYWSPFCLLPSTLHMLHSYLVGLLDRIERKKGAHTNGRRGEDAPTTVTNHQTNLHT
jgi:hypothetical protein